METLGSVLLVHADGTLTTPLRRALHADGYPNITVERVDSIDRALEILARLPVSALLLDLDLPGSQGLDGFIRLHLNAPAVPVVIFSKVIEPELGLSAVRAGAQDYITRAQVRARGIGRTLGYAVERQALRSRVLSHSEQLQFSEARFRLLINENADAIVVLNPMGVVRFANPAAAELFGKPRAELVGSQLQLPPPNGAASLVEIQRAGDTILVHVRVATTVWEGEDVLLATLRNVTRERAAVRELERAAAAARHQRELAQALADSAAALNSTLRHEQVVDRILENVGRVVPHDAASIFLIEGDAARFERGRGFSERGLSDWMATLRLPLHRVGHYQEMMRTRRAVSISETYTDPRWLKLGADWIASYVGAPLCVRDEVIGFLNLDSATPRFYTAAHAEDLQAFADQAATALANAQLLAQAEQRADRFAALHDVTRELAMQRDLASLLDTLVERAIRLLNAPAGSLALYFPEVQELAVTVVKGPIHMAPGSRIVVGEGMVGQVARTHQPLVVDDYRDWEYSSNRYGDMRVGAAISVPMVFGGELVGVLSVREWGESTHKFMEEDKQLLTLVATQAAAFVHNARLYQEMEKRAVQLSLLYDAGLTLNSVLEPARQLDFLTRIAMRTVHAERAVFFRYLETTHELKLELITGVEDSGYAYRRQVALDEPIGVEAWVARERLPVTLNNARADPRFAPTAEGVQSGIWVPVEHDNRLLGVLAVASTKLNAFTAQDERLLLLYASQAAVALENARLYQDALEANERRTVLHWASQAIVSAGLDAERVYVAIHEAVSRLMPCEAFEIALLDDAETTIHLPYLYDRGGRQPAGRIPVERGLTGHVIATGESLLIDDVASQPLDVIMFGYPESVASVLAVPLRHAGHVFGVLAVESYEAKAFTVDDRVMLETLGAHAAAALMNVRGMERTLQSLESAYLETALALAKAIDARDTYTAAHSDRLAELAFEVGQAMGLAPDDLQALKLAAQLHDIGKIGVPDDILRKPGPLTEDEWNLMKRHPEIGADILSPVRPLQEVIPIVRHHQERYDGTGYPDGLQGEAIPLGARILAVVDAYSAITDNRVYRMGRPVGDAMQELRQGAGAQFDPAIVELFLRLQASKDKREADRGSG